jgi:uncharacterized protein DUF4157
MRAAAFALFLILAGASAVAASRSWGVLEPLIAAESADTPDGALGKWRGRVLALATLGADVWNTTKAASMERFVETGAPILEKWIVTCRDQALEDGTRPMPPSIKERLGGFFPNTLLDRVRYRVGWGDRRPMQSSLFRLLNAKAVSFDSVVVFRDAGTAADPVIWAHELAHAQQYDRWGTREFAERYMRDHHAVESEAWEIAARYTMWALQEGKLAGAAPAAPARPEALPVDRVH